jgi:hypothetical protein
MPFLLYSICTMHICVQYIVMQNRRPNNKASCQCKLMDLDYSVLVQTCNQLQKDTFQNFELVNV